MRQKMTFKEVLEKYRQLLQAHPGKDLIIADGNAAVMEGGIRSTGALPACASK
ncbi:hypothetical protein YA0850_31930 [Pseudomonas veronii]|uniref:Uncharacterized protein n=1 Tax=Pseudomonas veronii TaxID=76761 RepID=A0ABS0VPY0_PSEVE|nr:hypothetical protein [Pseudomonas veronii]MBI6556959.1 hypothetical protein [Pseudomonas veronii]MBI6653530.1 hypothetical protein [Pseudomonas veronii]